MRTQWHAGIILLFTLITGCASSESVLPKQELLVIGASGRIGSVIVDEAIAQGYPVTGMTRNPASLAERNIPIVVGDILQPDQMSRVLPEYDVIIVSVGGAPTDPNPERYIAATAAQALIDVLSPLGAAGPRVIFVGNVFTLENADGQTFLEAGRVDATHRNYPMFVGHQIALDAFRESQGIRWTVASPPNGLGLKGRTGEVRWGGDQVLLDEAGKPSAISREDFAYAILEEVAASRYQNLRFTVAR